MNDITFEILKLAVTVIMILITRYVIPWLQMKLKNEVDEATWVQVMRLVRSIEQDSRIYDTGADKKEAVTRCLKSWAKKNKIELSDTQIENLIESAVFVMNNEKNKAS